MMDYTAIANPANIPAERRVFLSPHPVTKQSWCGHKIDVSRFPKLNCRGCWTFFFINNVEFVNNVRTILSNGGETVFTKKYGIKVVKRIKSFLATVDQAQQTSTEIDKQLAEEQLADAEYDIVVSPDGVQTREAHIA